jgi:hypothetical protein
MPGRRPSFANASTILTVLDLVGQYLHGTVDSSWLQKLEGLAR